MLALSGFPYSPETGRGDSTWDAAHAGLDDDATHWDAECPADLYEHL
jgi:hypothetical protein